MIPNVLAERYASPALQAIWSAEGRIVLEREFWIAVMKAQRDLGQFALNEAGFAGRADADDEIDTAIQQVGLMGRQRPSISNCAA